MSCEFVTQLSKLRKLSAESVENTKRFDPFKEYLHVERQVEKELRELLRDINNHPGKCLVLLCGSAGDGKSHLISLLKNSDSEQLLADYEPYNDATESAEPTMTSIETLAEKLSPFNDENYYKDDGRRMIVAINLGTLNNFIDSEKSKNFSALKEFVLSNDIISGFSHSVGYKENSVFQYVSFADYQVFSLGENGPETAFLKQLVSKVFIQSDENPFYLACSSCSNCPVAARCPVRHNYEFLSNQAVQDYLIRRIIEVVIADKAIVSTREVLNLIYDLIVHPDFDQSQIRVGINDVVFLTNYIGWSTPMLLNEYTDISGLINELKTHDILLERNSLLDESVTHFHTIENIEKEFCAATVNTPYSVLNNLTNVSVLGGIKPELKKVIYRFIVRLKHFSQTDAASKKRKHMDEFIRYLYWQNCGDEKKLGKLYEATKKAVMSWNGQFDDDYICIDDSNDQVWILEQLQLKSAINKSAEHIDGTIDRFFPNLRLGFRRDDQSEVVTISVDFALFELICNMREGYRPTIQDKNRHADFISFIQQLIDFGNKSSRITIIPKDGDQSVKMVFEETEFGYEFKVV